MAQVGDVNLFQDLNGGDISVVDGVVGMTGGFGVAAYLALFGGNELDEGGDDTTFQWWGNVDEVDPSKRYRSETQFLLKSLPQTSANLLALEEAALRDLEFFTTEKIANSIEVVASIPALNLLSLAITIRADGDESNFKFTENWKANE